MLCNIKVEGVHTSLVMLRHLVGLLYITLLVSPLTLGHWWAHTEYVEDDGGQCKTMVSMHVHELGRCMYIMDIKDEEEENGMHGRRTRRYEVYLHAMQAVVRRACYDYQCSM